MIHEYGPYIWKAVLAAIIWIGGLAAAGTEIGVTDGVLGVVGGTAAGFVAVIWKMVRDGRIEAQGRADYAAQQDFLERRLNAEIERVNEERRRADIAFIREAEARQEALRVTNDLLHLQAQYHGLEIQNQMLKGKQHESQ